MKVGSEREENFFKAIQPHAAARILSCGTALVEAQLNEAVIHKSSI